MKKQTSKLNPQWVKETRDYFLNFLKETRFPSPERNGDIGRKFDYPEWLIMLVSIISVKGKVDSYVGIHRLAVQYWDVIAQNTKLKKPISERQLRDRLKKICHKPGKPPDFIFQIFPESYFN